MIQVDRIIEAAHVVVGDGSELTDVAIAILDGTIVAVGPRAEVTATHDAPTTHVFGHHVVMPGLVNAHTHLAMTLLRGYAEGVDLMGFLERVWAAEAAMMDDEAVAVGTELAAVECLLGGTTTALDMYFHPPATHEAAVQVGLRHITGPIFLDGTGIDGMDFDARVAAARAWPEELARIGGPYVPNVLMPHGTYTVSPEHLRVIADLAEEYEALVTIHASETEAENADVLQRYGDTPVGVLEREGILEQAVRTVIGHGIHLSDADVGLLVSRDAAVAHCPGSNFKLASGMANVPRLRDAGVTVALGTDGSSSSNHLDMWIVMREAALVATQVTGSPAAFLATDVVRAATSDGALALGLGDRVGTVAVGFEADLIALDLDQPHLTPNHDLHSLLVFAAGRSDVTDVFVAGKHVVAGREVQTTDVPALLVRAREAADRAP